jgi:hypothetical protein
MALGNDRLPSLGCVSIMEDHEGNSHRSADTGEERDS